MAGGGAKAGEQADAKCVLEGVSTAVSLPCRTVEGVLALRLLDAWPLYLQVIQPAFAVSCSVKMGQELSSDGKEGDFGPVFSASAV